MSKRKIPRLNLPCKLSEVYLRLNEYDRERLSKRRGTVLYETKDGGYAIHFDGTKITSKQCYAKEYIEILPINTNEIAL